MDQVGLHLGSRSAAEYGECSRLWKAWNITGIQYPKATMIGLCLTTWLKFLHSKWIKGALLNRQAARDSGVHVQRWAISLFLVAVEHSSKKIPVSPDCYRRPTFEFCVFTGCQRFWSPCAEVSNIIIFGGSWTSIQENSCVPRLLWETNFWVLRFRSKLPLVFKNCTLHLGPGSLINHLPSAQLSWVGGVERGKNWDSWKESGLFLYSWYLPFPPSLEFCFISFNFSVQNLQSHLLWTLNQLLKFGPLILLGPVWGKQERLHLEACHPS